MDRPSAKLKETVINKHIILHGIIPLVSLAVLGVIIYSNSFGCSFHFDDTHSIVDNRAIRDLGNLTAIWNFLNRRFIAYLTFALNYHFHGLDVFGYHAVNLAVHIAASWLVWWLTILLLSTPSMRNRDIAGHKHIVALGCALVFLAHPIQTQGVTYIVQRLASLATMFYLSAVACYIKARLVAGNRRIVWFALSVLSAFLGIFTKENVATLPLALILCEMYFFSGDDRPIQSLMKRPGFWLSLVPFVVLVLLMLHLLSFNVHGIFGAVPSQRYQEPQLTSLTYFATQFRVIIAYIRLLFLPYGQNIDHDFPSSQSFLEAPVITSMVFLAAVLAFAVFIRSKNRTVSFGMLWFFLTISVESSIKPLHNVMFEHRLYLPMFGFALIIATLFHDVLWKRRRRTAIVLFIGLIGLYSTLTFRRNRVYASEFTLWSDAVSKSPNKARSLFSLASVMSRTGRQDDAAQLYRRALDIYPKYSEAYLNLGNDLIIRGDNNGAIRLFHKAIEIRPDYIEARSNLAVALTRSKKFNEAAAEYERILKKSPDLFEANKNLGIIFGALGGTPKALEYLEKAYNLRPNDTDTRYLLGEALIKMGRHDEAIVHLREAVRMQPDNARAHHYLGVCYTVKGNKEEAQKHLKEADRLIKLSRERQAPAGNR